VRVVIGIVGYYGFVRGYPLGPELMERLRALAWPAGVEIHEMNWGPVAIVQDFQARPASEALERVVLIGALDRGAPRGTVSCRRWAGGALDLDAVQHRMFEAVTGIVSLDNLLVIGGHFGIWPQATLTVELQWPESALGDLVLGELEVDRQRGQVVGAQPLTPDNLRIVQAIVDATRRLALDDPPPDVPPLTAAELSPVGVVSHHRFVDDFGLPPGHA
jgi:hypothetical protein